MKTKGILYYTDNQLNMKLANTCRNYIKASGLPITSVTLKPTKFGRNIVFGGERGYKTMFKQILTGLENMTEDVVYFCEHDVLYHKDHFEFTPTEDKFYYNGNYWILRLNDGFAIHYDVSPLSGLVAYRESLIKHFRERIALIEKQGFGYYMGFEPMTHNRIKWENWFDFEIFMPENPNIDIAHGANTTQKRWTQNKFRKKPKFWEESDIDKIKGWEGLRDLLSPVENKLINYKRDLAIVIPAKNEEFVGVTVKNILENIEANTEVIVILDGYEVPIPEIPASDRVTIIGHTTSVGQRVATNEAVRLSRAKYIMKVDAHCAFDKGFDRKMLEAFKVCGDNVTMIPVMRNLHAFDWVCKNGHRRYQSPSGVCEQCGEPTEKEIMWIAKTNPQSTAYRFDNTMHFQYWREYGKKQTGDLTTTLSIQGSCFMLTKERYEYLDICSETFNSWGQQGVEVACKTWLSGGRVLVNRKTWYAHMFRTQGGDFGFPYKNDEKKIDENRELSRDLFINDKWDKAVHKFQWLIDKFAPPDWETSEMKDEN